MVTASARPSPAARRARRLALFGGSFDPPHRGHLEMALAAMEARALEHVLWVPAAAPPHKPERTLASGEERVRMLELLLEGCAAERHSIWTEELERGGVSYTVDTLRTLAAELDGEAELFLVLGTDNLRGLPHWRSIDEIRSRTQAILLPRALPDGDPDAELERMEPSLAAWVRAGRLERPRIAVSSTAIRECLARGGDPGAEVPVALRAYLIEGEHYRERGST